MLTIDEKFKDFKQMDLIWYDDPVETLFYSKEKYFLLLLVDAQCESWLVAELTVENLLKYLQKEKTLFQIFLDSPLEIYYINWKHVILKIETLVGDKKQSFVSDNLSENSYIAEKFNINNASLEEIELFNNLKRT